MQTTKLIRELETEKRGLEARLEAVDKTLEGLYVYRVLSNGYKAKDEGKVETPKAKSKGQKRPTQPKVSCPDCGRKYRKGPGMSQHRAAAHGWVKGIPLYEPMPSDLYQPSDAEIEQGMAEV